MPTVTMVLFKKNVSSGFSLITVAKLSKVIGNVNSVGSNADSGDLSETLSI